MHVTESIVALSNENVFGRRLNNGFAVRGGSVAENDARGDEKVVDEESFLTFWLMLSTDAAARYEEAKLKSDGEHKNDGAVIAGTSSLVSMPVVVCMCVGIIVVDDELIKRLRTLKTGRREAIEPLNAAVVGVRIYSKGVIKYKTAPTYSSILYNIKD
uniref:Uncharacterized protein n=1 Tax=Glossina palpalis gambiensis TaxID=67801 RepID=A0A1B0B8G4_9MUSC